jgi:hypothetical protein
MDARSRLLQPYDEEVTIWQTLSAGVRRASSALDVNNGGEPADQWHRPAEWPIHLLCETFFCNKTRSPSSGSPRQTIVAAVVDRGILA